jgi:plasmid maintenance system killer protein
MKKILIALLLLTALIACQSTQKFVYKEVPNTPADGFDKDGSDAAAITIADSVMRACGGRYAWDMTRFMRWTFMGRRALIWDKWKERVRIDFLDRDLKIRLDMKTMTGRVWKDGQEMTQADSVKKYLERGKSIWINDSYWMVMPFKLKDSGVTLKYIGKKPNALGVECDVVSLTFKEVGDTPQNKYWVYVNPSSHLVVQWDFFGKATDEKPNMSTPWSDYRGLGNIMLALNRGDKRSMTPMGVYTHMPDSAFTSFYELDWKKIK